MIFGSPGLITVIEGTLMPCLQKPNSIFDMVRSSEKNGGALNVFFAPPPSYAGESAGQGCDLRPPFMWMNLLGKKFYWWLAVGGWWSVAGFDHRS
jgi:hypothetical protein